MKLIKPSFEIIEQEAGEKGLLRHIEKCGRTCYKSEDKITEDSAEKFVNMIINRGHTAMVEHGTVYLAINSHNDDIANEYIHNPYSNVVTVGVGESTMYYVTTNYRVLLQGGWLNHLLNGFQCEPTEHHEKRITVKFICDRGVSHEFVRHRVFSFAQESTRYCNYSKDKFGNEITCIIPSWLNVTEGSYTLEDVEEKYDKCLIINPDKGITSEAAEYIRGLLYSEKAYFDLLNRHNWIAQQARAVLPNSLKTELVMTGTVEQWEGFFKLRDAKDAHPQARELAAPLHEEFIKRGWTK